VTSIFHYIQTLFFILLLPFDGFPQYNTAVVAEILEVENTEFTELTANALNMTEVSQNLRFVVSMIRTPEGETSANTIKKEEGFTLDPFGSKILAETTINKSDNAKIIVLFLIYNDEDNLIGKARWVQNEEKDAPLVITKEEITQIGYDSAILRGIVTEDTRTKPGRDFHKLFYTEYFLSQLNAEEIISVKELLAFGRNTKIEVKIESTLISQFYLQPNEEFLKSMVKATMANIYRYLQNKKNIDLLIERY